MKFLTTFIGLTAVFWAFDGANAALRVGGGTNTDGVSSGRVSVASASTVASRRIPTMISSTTLATTTTTTSSSLMTDTECVDAYTECIRDPEVCGAEFEECTTSELFYAQKPKCNNVLLQCSSAGINTLFGTASTGNLATKNSNGEYVYPTAASVLGQFIEAGAINNRLDTSSCVKRYTSCLKKESVCGEEFELCTTNTEFKKQKLFCESTLARCQEDGIKELFGSTNTSSNPTSASRLGIMIKEGGDLAAVNAVSTCYKVVDQCFLGACSANPYKCITDSSAIISDITDAINEGRTLTAEQVSSISDARTSAQVSGYIKNSCLETIGGNKYCYATFLGEGKMPTAAQLRDEDNRDEVYAEAYAARMNSAMRAKIQEIADKFDKTTKDKCSDTIMACAMRSCGGGLGSACYKLVFGTNSSSGGTINNANTYTEIKTGCEAIVNTDANCQYSAASANEQTFNYNYSESGTFGTVFPTADTGKDPLGVVARLNSALAENYNDAAIDRMAKQCRNTAVSCIRSLCGNDFVNCYRNRTDIMTDTYDTEEIKFNQSMNKVGGVLDFTIVRGLCLETVKSADVCDEHLKIQSIRYNTDDGAAGWGNKSSVRDAWVDAVKDGYKATAVEVEGEFIETGLCTIDQSKAQSDKCKAKITTAQECDTVDEDGCLYDVEQVVARKDYQVSMAADTLFQEVMGDLEKEAQAKYNAKLTAEQHMCIDANNGGIMGRNDISSTYMWVKLRGRKVPKDYSTNGLKVNDFVASNDLYGSFCRARVSVQSDDPDIQRYLQEGNNSKNWTSAYFAVGDVFTCGSWIPQSDLEEIAKTVAAKKLGKSVEDAEAGKMSTAQKWATAAATIGSAGLGAFGMDLLQGRTGLGGLLNTNANRTSEACGEAKVYLDNLRSYRAQLTDDACKDASGNSVKGLANSSWKYDGTISSSSYRNVIQKRSISYKQGQCITAEDLSATITEADTAAQSICGADGNGDASAWGRAGIDALGATALGITGGLATGQNIKAANRQEFTEAQQEFMNNVGNHIYCFVGADEAGTYGDLIELSID
jgi:hypothetical protein